MKYTAIHPKFIIDMLGFLPSFISEDDPRRAREQLETNYGYPCHWHTADNYHILNENGDLSHTKYTNDPPYIAIAETTLRSETIRFFAGAYVSIIQPDGSFEMSRMD